MYNNWVCTRTYKTQFFYTVLGLYMYKAPIKNVEVQDGTSFDLKQIVWVKDFSVWCQFNELLCEFFKTSMQGPLKHVIKIVDSIQKSYKLQFTLWPNIIVGLFAVMIRNVGQNACKMYNFFQLQSNYTIITKSMRV